MRFFSRYLHDIFDESWLLEIKENKMIARKNSN
jgi:hypothetical protein